MQQDNIPKGDAPEQPKAETVSVNESPQGHDPEKNIDGLIRKKEELLAKNKSLSERLKAEQERNEAYQQKELESQGKLNELIDKLRADAELKAKENEKLRATYTHKSLTSEIALKASSKGMINPQDALSMVSMDGLGDLVDSEFNVNSDAVESMLENLKKQKPYLFKSNAPQVRDGVPVPSPAAQPGAPKAKSLDDLSHDEWHSMMVAAIKKEGR